MNDEVTEPKYYAIVYTPTGVELFGDYNFKLVETEMYRILRTGEYYASEVRFIEK